MDELKAPRIMSLPYDPDKSEIEYILKSEYDALQSELSALKQAVKDARDEMENYASEEQYDDEYLGLEHAVRIMNSHGLIGKE